MRERLPAFLAALWWGSLSSIGFLAVPLLFAHLPTSAMAGNLAAHLFAAQTWVSVACCMGLLLISRPRMAVTPYPWARAAMLFIVGGLLLALVVQHGVTPRIVARQDLKFWHGLGTLLYTLQWLCALATLWHTLRGPAAAQLPQA
jgi:hypothetical protein